MNRTALLNALGSVALIFSAAPAAHAGMPYTRSMTCAVGDEKFNFTTTGSYTVFGRRPDGKPYGSWHFP
jgi:hypothetical protein